jgi:hypothetical protein
MKIGADGTTIATNRKLAARLWATGRAVGWSFDGLFWASLPGRVISTQGAPRPGDPGLRSSMFKFSSRAIQRVTAS